MRAQLHFMSGVPRSGSTVLAAILNQNKQTHVSTTSGLVFALDGMANTWASTGLLRADEKNHKILVDSMRGVIESFYEDFDAVAGLSRRLCKP
jgi:sulfotransferase